MLSRSSAAIAASLAQRRMCLGRPGAVSLAAKSHRFLSTSSGEHGSGHGGSSTDWNHFESVPFSFSNRFTFALKMIAFTATGLAIPLGIVAWQM